LLTRPNHLLGERVVNGSDDKGNPVETARFQYETVIVQRHRTAAFPDCKAIITSFLTQNYLCRAIGSTSGDMTTSLLRLRLLYQSSTIPPSAQKSNERATSKAVRYETTSLVETIIHGKPCRNKVVPKAGLEPARLAAGDFEFQQRVYFSVSCPP